MTDRAKPSPLGWCFAQRIKIMMAASGSHTTIHRWHCEAVTDEVVSYYRAILGSASEKLLLRRHHLTRPLLGHPYTVV